MKDLLGNRGQAFTLEGFIGAIIVLTAVLLASQAVVITPTTGGSVDRTTQAQLQQETNDALLVADTDGELSRMIRYSNESTEEFYNNSGTATGAYTSSQFANVSTFGDVLEQRFDESGRNYNVELVAINESGGTEKEELVFQGTPSSTAVTASHMVTLRNDQRLTAPGDSPRLEDADMDNYPIPGSTDDTVYNVVEVRVIVW